MNLAGLSSLAQFNRTKVGTGGFLGGTGGGGGGAANRYPGTYGGGVLPGGYLRASPSNTGQARKIYGVDFPVVGFPDTGWDSSQRTNENIIPGATGEPQVLTTQNIPPNDASRLPITSFYLNPQEFGGGPNAPTYRNLPMSYPAPDMNIPPNEDVPPTLVNTFLSNYNPNVGTPRRSSGSYPDLSNLPPVSVSAPYGTASNPYPIPGYGGLPSNYGGGQSWQSNASRGGGFAGLANAAATGAGFGSGLTSQGGGWQSVSELPSGLGSMSWQQALGGGFQHYQL